jgi:hypothetical protein
MLSPGAINLEMILIVLLPAFSGILLKWEYPFYSVEVASLEC